MLLVGWASSATHARVMMGVIESPVALPAHAPVRITPVRFPCSERCSLGRASESESEQRLCAGCLGGLVRVRGRRNPFFAPASGSTLPANGLPPQN